MKTFKLFIALVLIVYCKNTMAQKTNEKSIATINKILITKIREKVDSLYKNDTYLNKHNLKPVYVLYIDRLNERKKSFVFSMTTMLNHYELKGTNSSHKLCFSDKVVIIRFNHKIINPNLINEVFDKLAENEIDNLSKKLLKSINGNEIVGPRKAILYTYKNGKYKEKWYDDKYTLPLELGFLDDEFIKHYNDSIDNLNKK